MGIVCQRAQSWKVMMTLSTLGFIMIEVSDNVTSFGITENSGGASCLVRFVSPLGRTSFGVVLLDRTGKHPVSLFMILSSLSLMYR